ncbi:MAG: ATP-binding protein [Geminicoccaceae bacterium]
MIETVEIVPSPSALVQSLRGLGYSPETALADLVDNSISSGATNISIQLDWNDDDPRVALLDDGKGMDEAGLKAAMCFGGAGPAAVRQDDDLGRFGLGLKTASLSQCRRMTVISRRDGRTSALSWDLDEIERRARWKALVPALLPDSPAVQLLLAKPRGTLVLWERMDAVAGLFGLDRETFFLRVRDIRAYMAMVFHRFLGGDARRISLSVNGRDVKGWDPFQRSHPATITMQSEPIRHRGLTVRVTPYVLPHRDRFPNEAEYEAAGGPGGWSERQGFYVYRQKRLLVGGCQATSGSAPLATFKIDPPDVVVAVHPRSPQEGPTRREAPAKRLA